MKADWRFYLFAIGCALAAGGLAVFVGFWLAGML